MKILLTGSTGFIGSRLSKDLLSAGYELNLLVVNKKEVSSELTSSKKVKVFELDIMKDDLGGAFEGVSAVLHLAAIRHRWGVKAQEYMDVNNGLTKKMLEYSEKANIKQFILCSSIAVFGWPKKIPINERFPYAPVNPYGESKVECEKLLKEWSKRTGIAYTIIRPSITYGEADYTGMITKYLKLMISGKYMTVGDGKNTMQLVYVGDLASGFVKSVLNKKAFNEDFIVTYKHPASVNELTDIIANTIGVKSPRIHIPRLLAYIPAVILEFFYKIGLKITGPEPIVGREKVDLMTANRSYDISKAEKILGYKSNVSYEEGVKRVYLWNKKNNLV